MDPTIQEHLVALAAELALSATNQMDRAPSTPRTLNDRASAGAIIGCGGAQFRVRVEIEQTR